jgi:transmembrane sensor
LVVESETSCAMDANRKQPEDLLSDETFVAWFRQSDPVHVRHWEDWILNHPENKAEVETAVKWLSLLDLQEKRPSREHTWQAKERLMASIRAPAGRNPPQVLPLYRRKAFWWTSAASIVAVLCFLSLLWWMNRGISYETRFGEIKSVTLPDRSQVTLNANSRLRLARSWNPAADREVWLDGEGYFSVKHSTQHTRFTVHAGEINVEVLGTEFNLQKRSQHTTVVLKSGKVQLTLVEETGDKPLVMKPGDLVEYRGETRQLVRKMVDANTYTAWKEGKMVFENAGIQEIARVLEDTYGVEVDIDDLALKGKEFNGVFPTNNLTVLLQALSKAYDLEIQQREKEIIIRNKSDHP